MDRLEKMVSDIAAAVGRGGGAPMNRYRATQATAAPRTSQFGLMARSNSIGDMKKQRVDLEVQIDAMREQIERLQDEMKKLDENIANHDSGKRSKGDLSRPSREELQAK